MSPFQPPVRKYLALLGVAVLSNCSDPNPGAEGGSGSVPSASIDTTTVNMSSGSQQSRTDTPGTTNEEDAIEPRSQSQPTATQEGAPDLTRDDSTAPSPTSGLNDESSDMPEPPAIPEPSTQTTPLPFSGDFILGADVSGVPETIANGAIFVDTDGEQKSLLVLLKNHGFNYIRLRTFLDPLAQYGYGSANGNGCQQKAEAFNDLAHVVAFAQQAKAEGFGYLLDLHYSDTWADPGKQVIPEAWRGATSIEQLAGLVSEYTSQVVQAMIDAGARPDMVQVGNEITPGMLIHVPTANTDCYGNNSTQNQEVTGRANNWNNLGTLLRAGANAVRQVDDSISVMLHIENTDSLNGVSNWVRQAQQQNVDFDVLGLSAYETFQGPANAWDNTLQSLSQTFPELDFAIAEYNPQRRLLNDIMRGLPQGHGLGTFFWEPTRSGSWGDAMFDRQGNTFTARAVDFVEFDQMRSDYELP